MVGRALVKQEETEALVALFHQLPVDVRAHCGIDVSVLGDTAKALRQQCFLDPDTLSTAAPHLHSRLSAWLASHRQAAIDSRGGTLVAIHPPLLPRVASFLGDAVSIYLPDHLERVCRWSPGLCQGFNYFHRDVRADDSHPDLLLDWLMLSLHKDAADRRRSNIRVVPRSAVHEWTVQQLRWLSRRPKWQVAAVRHAVEALWEVACYTLGEGEARYWEEQLTLGLAACTVVLDPGDVLWFAADVLHQTQGTAAHRLALRLTSESAVRS